MVKRFFDQGSTILCVDKDKDSLDRLKSDLFNRNANDFSTEILNKRLKFYVVDIRSVHDVKAFASNVKNEFKNIDILIKYKKSLVFKTCYLFIVSFYVHIVTLVL